MRIRLSFDPEARAKWHEDASLAHGRIRRETRWAEGASFLLSANTSGLLSLCHDFAWLAAQGGEILFEPVEAGGPGLLESGSHPLLVALAPKPGYSVLDPLDLQPPNRMDLGHPPWEEGSVVDARVESAVFHIVGNRPALISLATHACVLARPGFVVGDTIGYDDSTAPLVSGSTPFLIRKM